MQPKLVCKSHNVYTSSWHLDSESKRISDLACVEKEFILSFFSYEISEFLFSYTAFFKMLGSCPNKRKLIVRVAHGM